jgi:hypothetical protein
MCIKSSTTDLFSYFHHDCYSEIVSFRDIIPRRVHATWAYSDCQLFQLVEINGNNHNNYKNKKNVTMRAKNSPEHPVGL